MITRRSTGQVRSYLENRPSPIDAVGLFTVATYPNHDKVALFKKGETIAAVPGDFVEEPNSEQARISIQLEKNLHLIPHGVFAYMNHSCQPNAHITYTCKNGNKEALLIAKRDILAGEEITYDYCSTEQELRYPFSCSCGSSSCRQVVKCYKFLSQEQKATIPYALPYLTNSDSGHT